MCALGVVLLATPALAQSQTLTPAQQRAKAKAQNVPEIAYESVPNFLKMPPNLYLGEGVGVATNSKGHIFIYTRSQDTRLFEFDKNGAFIREIGQGLYISNSNGTADMDHGEIYKLELDGKIVGKFGRAGKLLKEFGSVHEIDCRSENEILVGELTNWRVQKLTLHPTQKLTLLRDK